MKRRFCRAELFFIIAIILVSCATAATAAYSLTEEQKSKSVINSLVGNISFVSGYYLPSVNNSIEISLVSQDGFVLSKQTISNVQKFPLQCVLKYDKSEVQSGLSYSVEVRLETAEKTYTAKKDADISKDKTIVNLSL